MHISYLLWRFLPEKKVVYPVTAVDFNRRHFFFFYHPDMTSSFAKTMLSVSNIKA